VAVMHVEPGLGRPRVNGPDKEALKITYL